MTSPAALPMALMTSSGSIFTCTPCSATRATITTASTRASTVSRGSTFTIYATVRNYADYSHSRLMLGASLTGPTSASDSAHDKKITEQVAVNVLGAPGPCSPAQSD